MYLLKGMILNMRKNKIISILIIFVILSSYLPAMLNIVNAVEETQKINAEEITAKRFENEKLGQYIFCLLYTSDAADD